MYTKQSFLFLLITLVWVMPIFGISTPIYIDNDQLAEVPCTMLVNYEALDTQSRTHVVTTPVVGPRALKKMRRKQVALRRSKEVCSYSPYALIERFFASGSTYLANSTHLPAKRPYIVDPRLHTNVVTLPDIKYRSYREKRRMKARLVRQKRYAHNPEHKLLSDMNYEELVRARDHAWVTGQKTATLLFVEQILRICDDSQKRAIHMIELADLYFEKGDLKRAKAAYLQFALLYPGSKEIANGIDLVEYAQYRAVLASFYNQLDAERDQSDTHDTLALAKIFLEREALYTTYSEEVKKIVHCCYQSLAENELHVCRFYLKMGDIEVAKKRLEEIQSEWLEKIPELSNDIQLCAHYINDMALQRTQTEEKRKQLQRF